jgi:branched-chain amino acid transport system ATP-binding protein
MSGMLTVSAVDLHYGDFQAIYGLDLELAEGETLAVIGANGAGKSTLMKSIAGLMRPTKGEIVFRGRSIARTAPHKRVELGIALTPEGRRIFPSLTVEENLRVGGHTRRKGPWDLKKIYEVFPLVADRRDRRGTDLSGGEQQAAAIARALMSNPELLLLDEVSLGLAPVAVADIYRAIPPIIEQGTSVLLVEQDANQSLAVADRILCLLEGRTVLEGSPATLTREQITSAYFGV